MMSKKSPQLRFEGFTDDWEERKLSELIQKGGSGGTPKSTNKTYYDGDIPFLGISDISKSNGYIDDTEKHISEKGLNNSSAWIVPKGAISLAMYASVGKLAILNIDAATSQAFYNMVFEYESIRDYVYHRLGRANDLGEWTKLISTGTQANLNADKVKNFEIQVPQSIDEMKDISTFFNQLDIFITLQQHKLDLLKEQKKGYLQKMFPKNGEKVPELRFAGFADDWEERKLSDVANHRGGTAIEKYFDKDGVYKVISIGSYGLNSQYVDQNIRAISNKITDGRVVNSGELTMVLNDKTANGTIIGRSLLVEKDNEYVINQRTEIISPKENFDSNFAYTILNGPFREKVKRIVQGGTQIYVNYPAVSNLNLELPKIEEQQKIGSFFKQLDDTIALHQCKLDLLKEQKKGFLQKMFV
ncbi:restriction endonuclease subunit S [Enterococcus faecalis]|uniref:restriction endonuclease subunit S n=1 Tax=Enterococcus faecalis TaxID=1351 RepID=UPI003A598CAE